MANTMVPELYHFKVIVTLTLGFVLSSVLGYFFQRIKLSPILGYMLSGYFISPFFPGFVGDLEMAKQLAEVGVILMMFGVGLHFKWEDLLNVKNIAIPGAIGQTLGTVFVTAILINNLGWSWQAGIIIGLAIGVASTVVLARVLSDNHLLITTQGYIAVGWLIIEDIMTVIVLILLPTIVDFMQGEAISILGIIGAILLVIAKFTLLTVIMFTLGRKIISYALFMIARTRSHELFTLTVLSLVFVIATGSTIVFGTSIALGAFIAGMAIGQTDVSHQASAHASTIKDAFVALFFISVGMLFNPLTIIEDYRLFLTLLFIILVIKPIIAFLIVHFLRYSIEVALTIALALAQIGEFSFILAEEALKFKIFPEKGYDVIIACALISITINPILFKIMHHFKISIKARETRKKKDLGEKDLSEVAFKVLVIGFGAIGKRITHTLEKIGFKPIVIDRNVDIVTQLIAAKQEAIYGDASLPQMLELAQIESASLLIITISDFTSNLRIIEIARQLHPTITILTRVQHQKDQISLSHLNVNFICCDEEEAIKVFNSALFRLSERFVLA